MTQRLLKGGPSGIVEEHEVTYSWLEHTQELRRRLLLSLGALTVALIVGYCLSDDTFRFLRNFAYGPEIQLLTLQPLDALRIKLQISLLLAILIAAPFLAYQLWRFVAPGLVPRERSKILLSLPFAGVLFLAGCSVGAFGVFPILLDFTTELNATMELSTQYEVGRAISFFLMIVVPTGCIFELPVLLWFLSRVGLVNARMLAQGRRYAYFALILCAALVAPGDFSSHVLFTIPLLMLYESSVWVLAWLEKRAKRA